MTAMMRTVLMAVVLMASFVLASGRPDVASAQVSPSQQPLFTGGFLPVKGGVGLIVFVPGGSMLKLAGAAQIEGCSLEAVWVSSAGTFSTYIYKAPAFVNEPFLKAIPNGELPANSPVLVRCGKPPITETQGSDTPSACSRDWPAEIREKVLSRMSISPLVCFYHYPTQADAERAGFWRGLTVEAKRIYEKSGGVGWWNGRTITIVGPMNLDLLTHELASANFEWYASLVGSPFQWSKTPAAMEFERIGEWKKDDSTGLWTSKGLEGISYKPNPGNAASEIVRIMLNPTGRYTQAEIDALVPVAYQQWVQKWVIVR